MVDEEAGLTADEVAERLGLKPLPGEGGHFVETYRSPEILHAGALPRRYGGPRVFGTAIYYLLREGAFSALHRLRSDEIWHFYLGDPVEMLLLPPNGHGEVKRLGGGLQGDRRPQVVVPGGTWQGARLLTGGAWALMGTTTAPGFQLEDFVLGRREDLQAAYPEHSEMIRALTRG